MSAYLVHLIDEALYRLWSHLHLVLAEAFIGQFIDEAEENLLAVRHTVASEQQEHVWHQSLH